MNAESLLEALEKPALPNAEKDAFVKQLSQHLNHLLLHDFPQLVQLLYRVDVSEKKVKTTLKENVGEDAGDLLAALIMQRQAEKRAAKNAHRFSSGASEEERW